MAIQKTTATTKSLLTVTQAAKILKVSPDTLRNWEKSGKLIPERSVGGARRYQLSVLQELVAEKSPEIAPRKKGMLSISKAAKELGVSTDTLRNWEKKGQISAERTDGGARRYSKSQLTFLKKELGLEQKQAQIVNPVVINENDNTIGIGNEQPQPEAKVPEESIYHQTKVISRSSFTVFRLALPIIMLILFLFPIAFFGFSSDKGIGLEQKVYDLASNVENLQTALFNVASKSGDLKRLPKSSQDVLAVSSIANLGKYFEVNADTSFSGSIAVEGEGIFIENITAPNIIYGLVAGANVTITGDSQNPVISANAAGSTDTLASVTSRGATTSTPVQLLGGVSLGNILTLGQLNQDPGTGTNGDIYYNSTNNKYRCYINGSWQDCDTDTDTVGETGAGDIESVIAGDGLTGGGITGDVTLAIDLTVSGSSLITSSASGLEASIDGLSMLRGCTNGQLLKWNSGTEIWECSNDVGGLSSAVVDIREEGTPVGTNITILNFEGDDFTITESPSGTDNFAIDYTNSGITRSGQNETISGNWTFSSATPLAFTSLSPSISIGNTGILNITDGTNTLLTLTDNGGTGTLSSNALATQSLDVGSGALQINSSGAITAATGITSSGTISLTPGGTNDIAFILNNAGGSFLTITGLATGTASNALCLDASNNVISCTYGGGTGDITAVGSMTSGDAFAGIAADDQWLGLGASAGRIEFDDQTTDEINFLTANIGIGDASPASLLTVGNGDLFQVNSSGNVIFNQAAPTVSFNDTGSLTFTDGTNPLVSFDDDNTEEGRITLYGFEGSQKSVSIDYEDGGFGEGYLKFTAGGTNGTIASFRDCCNEVFSVGGSFTASRFGYGLRVDNQETDTGDGLQVNFIQADDADATDIGSALQINGTSNSGDADTFIALDITDLSSGAASETAINIGTGWDTILDTPSFDISGAGVISGLTGYSQLAGAFTLTPDGTNDVNITVANASSRYLNIGGLATGTASNGLCLDASSNVITCTYGGGTGDITAVGSMTTGDAFADATADDDWLGLGASAGRIEFDDQGTDEINFLTANVGIGTSTPVNPFTVSSSITDSAVTLLQGTATGTSAAASILTVGGTVSVSAAGGAVSSSILQSTAMNIAADVQVEGMRSLVTFTPSVANTTGIYGYQNNFRLGSSSSNISDIYGMYSKLRDNGYTGTVSRVFSFKADDLDSFAVGEVTGQAGFNTAALANATNNTHVLLGSTTIPAGNFGIYSATSYVSYFAGNVGIGDISPTAALTVGSGDAFQVNSSGNIVSIGAVAHAISNSSGELLIDSNGSRIILADDLQILGTGTISDSNNNEAIVINSTTNAVNHIKIFNAATGNAASISAVGTDTNVSLNLDGQLTGQINIGNNSTGDILIGGGSASTGCTVTNASGNLTCTGNITGGATGTVGYWSRSGTTLSPTTSGDSISFTGNMTAGGATAQFNSPYSFLRSGSFSDAPQAGLYSQTTITGGGGTATVPVGVLGMVDQSGGTANHLVGVLGMTDDTYGTAATWFGAEGRSEANTNGDVVTGVKGLAYFDNATSSSSIGIGVMGEVDKAVSSGAGLVGIGGWFRIADSSAACTVCYNAVFGQDNDNYRTQFRGQINSSARYANFSMDDTYNQFMIDTYNGGSNVVPSGVAIKLGDALSAAEFSVMDSGGTVVSSIDSDGNVLADGTVTINSLNASSAVYTNGSKNLTSTAPTSGAIGYLSRSGTTLSPTTSGDNFTTSGNISTTSTGTLTIAGATNLNGTIGLGDATGDTITFTGYVGSNILPSTDDTYALGSSSLRWSDVYVGPATIHVGTSTTDEGTISYNTTSNILNIGTDSTTNGDIAFFTDDLYLDKSTGNIGINTTGPGAKLDVADGNDGGGAQIWAKDGGIIVMAGNGASYPFQVGNNAVGANSVRFRMDSNGGIDYTNIASTPTLTTFNASSSFNILTGNLKVGNGTPGVTLDGEDAYIEGTLEVDGTVNFGATLTVNGGNIRLDNNTSLQILDSTAAPRALVTFTSGDIQTFGTGNNNTILNGFAIDLTSALSAGQATTSAFDIKSSVNLGATDELVQFGDSAADFMTILGNGRVGLGNINPSTKLDIAQPTASTNVEGIRMTADTVDFRLYSESALLGAADIGTFSNHRIRLYTNSTPKIVIMGTGDTTFTGSGGSCTITGAGACSSDARLKRNVTDFSSSLDKIMDLRPVTYQLNPEFVDQSTHYGFIAQEIQNIYPELVSTITDEAHGEHLGLNYAGFVVPIVKGMQELNQKLENALLTIGENGYANKEFTAKKLSITSDANITGTITAGTYAIDASKLNRTGTIASIAVSSTNTASIADAVNALDAAQQAQNARIALIETQTATQSAILADQSTKLENTQNMTSDLEIKVTEQKSALDLFREQIESQINELNAGESAESNPVLTSPDELIATGSATIAEFTAKTISGNQITVSETLSSLGETNLANTFIAGDLIVDGTLSITQGNELNVIGAGENEGILYIQRSPLANIVNFFDGLFTLDKSGSFKAPSVTVAEFKVVANKISGSATIIKGDKSVIIDNPFINQNVRILVTPTSDNGAILAVTKKVDNESFTVSSAFESTNDITFDWWMVQEVDGE